MNHNGWDKLFEAEFQKDYYTKIEEFLLSQQQELIFPAESLRFRAFDSCPPESVKVVVMGQDPYHTIGMANGLAFSVDTPKLPPSLKNIYKELVSDLSVEYPTTGSLDSWARQGVLLINSSLTVEAHLAGSHSKIGWTQFTDAVVEYLNSNFDNIVYIVWGAHAYKRCENVDRERNCVIVSSHPSPLSANKPFGEYPKFLGSRPFSTANSYLKSVGKEPINWSLSRSIFDDL